jgi:uncharacterized glyoxalase superfamily protein PhnB
MSSATTATATDRSASRITGIVPQFLVNDIDPAVAYYRDKLGFEHDFTHDSFYASVSRNGFAIHLKHVDALPPDRAFRRQNEHLDAHIAVSGIRDLFSELQTRGAVIFKPLEERPWGCLDFYVEDPDGYVLCFSERIA